MLRVSDGEAPPGSELPVLGLASFSLAKALGKEKIGSWVREPLVEPDPEGGRRPSSGGMLGTLGELVTCTRCLGTWGSLGLVGLRVARPREGRIVATILAAAALNDILQTGYSIACARANELGSS